MATSARKLKAVTKSRSNGNGRDFDVHDLGLAEAGRKRIEWADKQMPVLRRLRERFAKEQPLKGQRMGACLHITCRARQPAPHAEGRRRRSDRVRVESALDPG